MRRFTEGDRVRIDIPDKRDPDHDQYHGANGTVVEVFQDGASHDTGDERDDYLFRVDVDNGPVVDMRWRDLRPTPD